MLSHLCFLPVVPVLITLELITDKRSCAESESTTNGSSRARVAHRATDYASHRSTSECPDTGCFFARRQRTSGTTRKGYSPGNHQH